ILSEAFTNAQIFECEDGEDALVRIKAAQPEISILDINMPIVNGLDVCKAVLNENLNTRVIILTMHSEKEVIKKAMMYGAWGYILKDNAVQEIVECINEVIGNKKYVGAATRPYYSEINSEDKKKTAIMELLGNLSQAELKTLKLVSQNRTSKEIAELLFLSEKTVENYRSRICQKLALPARNNSLLLWISENREFLKVMSEF
ncbi:MAG: response regulator transcription factor, partial [Bacteroidia bacterium]|nr:response regulator transcription factor [Bacteroidia bacterium]